MTPTVRVLITISEPWDFYDENGGDIKFYGNVVATTCDGIWIVRLERPAVMRRVQWDYAVPVTRYVGQAYFDDPGSMDKAANVLFIQPEQALSMEWRRTFDPLRDLGTSWAAGSCEVTSDRT